MIAWRGWSEALAKRSSSAAAGTVDPRVSQERPLSARGSNGAYSYMEQPMSNPEAPDAASKSAPTPDRSGTSGSKGASEPFTPPPASLGAEVVRDAVMPAFMKMAIAPKGMLNGASLAVYRDQILKEAGGPTDPLERMLIEQALLANVMIVKLHGESSIASTVAGAEVYATAAVRLMAELRRTILAIREYRTPPARPIVTRIEQQNVAHSQSVSYAAGVTDGKQDVKMACRDKEDPDSKVGSNLQEAHDAEGEIPSANSRWTEEPATAGAALG